MVVDVLVVVSGSKSMTACLCVYVCNVGVPLLDGGTVRLPQLIGLSRALDLILCGRAVNATEALSMGLANRVVQTGAGISNALLIACCIYSLCF